MFTPLDQRYMARALELAKKELISPHPNPRVGCVLVSDGQIIGEGWHARAGESHAEAMALEAARGQNLRGATVYVTLEPCNHHGRTPPCADALIEAGVGRVIAAMEDPNPLVAGQGMERLRAQGIQVQTGLMGDQAEMLNRGFIKRMTGGRPWVRVKSAMSLDGRTALASGDSKWISSPAARRDVQRLRASSDAILTGIGTVLADDPSLTLREAELGIEPTRQPLRVVLDSRGRLSRKARLLQQDGRVLHVTAGASPVAGSHIEGLVLQAEGLDEERAIDLQRVMDALGQRNINEVQVEAGSVLTGALLSAGLVDEWIIYMAPCLLGADAKGMAQLESITSMNERLALRIQDVRAIGPDWRLTVVPQD